MYTLTRQNTADKLDISTRSVDRYIKSGKLRSKKEGKIIYIHARDVANLLGEGDTQQEIITEKNSSHASSTNENSHSPEDGYSQKKEDTQEIVNAQSRATLEKIYLDLRTEIKQKDDKIVELSGKLGQAQEIAKNSVSLVEFKKSQFLLEESKGSLEGKLSQIEEEKKELHSQLKYEKSTNYILIAFCIVLVCSLGFFWFQSI